MSETSRHHCVSNSATSRKQYALHLLSRYVNIVAQKKKYLHIYIPWVSSEHIHLIYIYIYIYIYMCVCVCVCISENWHSFIFYYFFFLVILLIMNRLRNATKVDV